MSVLLVSILFFLGTSLIFYVLFAGADFGAGILEFLLGGEKRAEKRALMTHAIAPVWEANHMWLVLAIVILFNGFPEIYVTVSTYAFIPIGALLIGIVIRGCAFSFRYYDAGGGSLTRTYSPLFAASSLWSAFWIGVLAGTVTLGRITLTATTFPALYIDPWFNLFCFSLGLFCVVLFALLASVYLVGEAEEDELRNFFRKRAALLGMSAAVIGAAVFLAAQISGFPLLQHFFSTPFSLGAISIATVLLPLFWWSLKSGRNSIVPRAIAAAIVSLIVTGWFAVQFPGAIRLSGATEGAAKAITFAQAAAPAATLRALLIALLTGSVLIFPALFYLFKIFKWETLEEK